MFSQKYLYDNFNRLNAKFGQAVYSKKIYNIINF